MASCPSCGRTKLRKRPDGRRKCTRCGFHPSGHNLQRNGEETPAITLHGKKPANPFGSCFDSAAWNIIGNNEWGNPRMCHGIGIANLTGQEGRRIAHAWIEFDHPKHGVVAIDPIWLIPQSAEIYRKNLQVEYSVTYNCTDFIALWVKYDYPGPYDDKIKALTERVAKAA